MDTARTDSQLLWTVALTLLTLVMALYTSGCTPKQPPAPAPPSLAQRLDTLYRTDRGAWRAEMERLLQAPGPGAIPVRHLALALDAFNDQTTRELCLTAAARYLSARTTSSGTMATEADRELLNAFAEKVLTSADPHQMEALRKVCNRADREPVCRGRF